MLMLLSLKKQRFQTIEKNFFYCLNLIKFKSCKLDKLSLKKKKSLLEFYLSSNMLKNQKYYIIENNIKATDNKYIKECKSRKLVKSAVLLSDNSLFNEKDKMKYFLRLLIFSSFISLKTYSLTLSKQENCLPSFIKVNFLFFKKLQYFLLYLIDFGTVYINFNFRLKLSTL